MKKVLTTLLLAIACLGAGAQNQATEERIGDILSQMSLHEKILLLHAQSKFTSPGVPRLGIRQLSMSDGPHGVRAELEWNSWRSARWTNDSIVAFPSLSCLAASWNRELSALYGSAVSEEFAFRGKDVLLGPGVNIARTPLNGRAFEYMGEDPLLAGEMAVPYIIAAQENGIACCLKHFVLNDQETDRFGVNVNVSERALREIYLAPFKMAVDKAHVWSIMGSYNYYKGVHGCQNGWLINDILKDEWQWDGALISDWGGTTDTPQATFGGLDIEMGTYTDGKERESPFGYEDYFLADKLEALVLSGDIPESVVDEKAARVLRLILRTSMNPQKVIGAQCSEAHYEACRRIGEEGIVLLKNEASALPLSLDKCGRILVVGENATRSLTEGGGSSELKTRRDISPLEALQRLGKIDYAQGYYSGNPIYDRQEQLDPSRQEALMQEALSKAREADLVIFVGGLNKNHGQDCENGDRESYDLPFGQNELISRLAEIQNNIIVVTFGGNAYATPWISKVKALLHCWYLGSEAGEALANVLSGKVTPSGKLPVTFARRYEDYPYVKFGERAYPGLRDVPATPNSAGEIPSSQVWYDEGIFVGYRGFEKSRCEAQFPFGYGLSYTTFEYGNASVKTESDSVRVTLEVTNTGAFNGKEIVQVYVSAPGAKRKDMPLKELKAFAKTGLLEPGGRETLSMTIPFSDLTYWNETTHGWKAESGTYIFSIGASSADIRQSIKEKILF